MADRGRWLTSQLATADPERFGEAEQTDNKNWAGLYMARPVIRLNRSTIQHQAVQTRRWAEKRRSLGFFRWRAAARSRWAGARRFWSRAEDPEREIGGVEASAKCNPHRSRPQGETASHGGSRGREHGLAL